jgi:hypothetical protein
MSVRPFALVGLLIGLCGLVLQFVLTIPAALAAGRSLAGSVVFYFSFFTILTNLAVVMVYAALLVPTQAAAVAFFRRRGVRAALAAAITVVMITYIAVLAQLWSPQGAAYAADIVLHYVAPVYYLAFWLLMLADGRLRFRQIAWWLAYPIAYLAYVLARSPLAGEVPYPFLDAATHGAGGVAMNALFMTALFVAVSALLVLADRLFARQKARTLLRDR